MPQSAASLRNQLADRNANPSRTVALSNIGSGGANVFVSLRFQRTMNPEDIFDALEAKFGAGKVISDLDNNGHGQFSFTILA